MNATAYPATERSITAILAEDFGITHRGPGTAHELFDRDGMSLGFHTARAACEMIERLQAAHAAGVAAAIVDRDLLLRAIYSETHIIAPRGKSLVEMLSDCSRLLRAQAAKRAAGHWTASPVRLASLEQAQDALLALILADEPLPLSNAA